MRDLAPHGKAEQCGLHKPEGSHLGTPRGVGNPLLGPMPCSTANPKVISSFVAHDQLLTGIMVVCQQPVVQQH